MSGFLRLRSNQRCGSVAQQEEIRAGISPRDQDSKPETPGTGREPVTIPTKARILTSRLGIAPSPGQDRGAQSADYNPGAQGHRETDAAPPPPQLAAMRRGVRSRKATKICN